MPLARSASRIVAPSGTRAATPSIVISTSRRGRSIVGNGWIIAGLHSPRRVTLAQRAAERPLAEEHRQPGTASRSGAGRIAGRRARGDPPRAAPTSRSSCASLKQPQPVDRRQDRRRGGLAEPTDGSVAHNLVQLAQQRDLLLRVGGAGDQPTQRLLLPHRADAARDALPARLVAEKGCDADDYRLYVHRIVEDHHHAGPERRAGGPGALQRKRNVQLVRADE